jgi:hypothetical protein
MRPARRAVAARHAAACVLAPVTAVVLAALLLAACTTGWPTASATPASTGPPGATAARSRAAKYGPAKHGLGFKRSGSGGSVSIVNGGPGGAFILGAGGFVGPAGAFAVLPVGGPAGGSGRPQISVPPIPPAGSGQTVALPLDSYEEVSVQEQDALTAADDLLTQRCMAAAGFSYPVAAQPGGGAATVQSIEDGGYGVPSLAQAESYGYNQPGQNGAGAQTPAGIVIPGFLREQNTHGTAWTSALLGFVPGARADAPQREGCLQAADSELYGELAGNPDPDPVPAIVIEAAQWTQSDPRILIAARAWSACMARGGFDYKSPAQAAGRNWPSTPTPAEIAAAVADVRCKTQANLVNTWLTVEAAYQQTLVGQNATSLSRLQANFGALLRRAEDLLQLPAATGILRVSRGRVSRGNLPFVRAR